MAPTFPPNASFNPDRLHVPAETSLTNGDFSSFSSAWGSTGGTISAASGSDSAGHVSVNCGGTGIGSNPRVTWAWKDGAYGRAPIVIASVTDDSGNYAGVSVGTHATTSACELIFQGTPTSGRTYTFSWLAFIPVS